MNHNTKQVRYRVFSLIVHKRLEKDFYIRYKLSTIVQEHLKIVRVSEKDYYSFIIIPI